MRNDSSFVVEFANSNHGEGSCVQGKIYNISFTFNKNYAITCMRYICIFIKNELYLYDSQLKLRRVAGCL